VKSSVWIGLVGVIDESEDEILRGARGAYVNVLALALSEKDYTRKVKTALESVGLRAFEFDDMEAFSDRETRVRLRPKLKQLAKEVARTGVVTCDEFYVFKKSRHDSALSFRVKRGISQSKQRSH
jgi:hypothetical protein